jgi:hypothetical protein
VRFFLGVVCLILASISSVFACSAQGCLGDGIELSRNFDVVVKHDGKALQGVSVNVTSNTEYGGGVVVSGTTSSNGIFRVKDLAPGKYWLNAELLGVTAGSQCFHVENRPSASARTNIQYDWGDLAPATRQIAGKFVYGELGQGGTRLLKYLHQREVPIDAATLSLRSPFGNETYKSVSDSNGHFSFPLAPEGVYVLHIDAGRTSVGHHYGSADLLIRLAKNATSDDILLKQMIAGFGNCGGINLTTEPD